MKKKMKFEFLKKNNISDNIILIMYASYFILSPFYLWSSGLPQIADIMLVLTMIFYLLHNRFKLPVLLSARRYILLWVLFIAWVILTNLIWAFVLQTSEHFFKPIFFYFYNFLVTILTISMRKKYKQTFLNTVLVAIIISITIQFLLFIVRGGYTGVRTTGTFNNPNQLGYYAILITCFIMFFYEQLRMKNIYLVGGLLLSSILVLASLSNGAIIAWSLLLFLFLFSKGKNKREKRKIIKLTIVLILPTIYFYNNTNIIQENIFYQAIERRMSETQDKIGDASIERGYNRIIDYPQYWILGAGEGAFYRFEGHGGEMHSTLGTIQVSYGIMGTFLFLLLIVYSIKGNKYRQFYIVFSLLVYGISHNGLRESMFWILLSLLATQEHLECKKGIIKNE